MKLFNILLSMMKNVYIAIVPRFNFAVSYYQEIADPECVD